MLSRILIIDSRKELPAKYKKTLDNVNTSVIITRTISDGLNELRNSEPDLILVSDSINEKLPNFCNRIRALTCNFRPIIIALSKSADTTDRILTLENGADDFISEPVNIEEFKSRVNAHLRRDIELNLDNKTLLPNRSIVDKMLKRVLHTNQHYALLLIGIENINNYKSIYSELAADKLIQTFIAITKSTLEEDDFIGQVNETDFIIITNVCRAEKLCAFLTFAFDTVAPKFYSESDAKRGYMLLKSDGKAGMRADFVSILIGAILGDYELSVSSESILERLYSLKKIAKIPSGSNYTIDRLKLTGENSVSERVQNNRIYVNEKDSALALLLRTSLELQGYDVTNEINFDSANQPSILIIDIGQDMEGLEICRNIKSQGNFVNSKIIITTTIHDKTAVLDAGADLYLPKPYELDELVAWIEYFKREIMR